MVSYKTTANVPNTFMTHMLTFPLIISCKCIYNHTLFRNVFKIQITATKNVHSILKATEKKSRSKLVKTKKQIDSFHKRLNTERQRSANLSR